MRQRRSEANRVALLGGAALIVAFGVGVPAMAEPPDGVLTMKAKSALVVSDEVDAGNIDVATEDGVVTLSGTVATERERRSAERVVADLDGVRSIRNELRVEGQEGMTSRRELYAEGRVGAAGGELRITRRGAGADTRASRRTADAWSRMGYERVEPPSDLQREVRGGEQELMDDVNAALAERKSLAGTSIRAVSAAGRVVLLSGSADNLDQELEAVEVAQSVSGVDGVMSEVFTLDVDEEQRVAEIGSRPVPDPGPDGEVDFDDGFGSSDEDDR